MSREVVDATRERLIAAIYGALLGTSDWVAFLDACATLLPDGRATLLHHDGATQASAISLQARFPEAMQQAYNEHYARLNPWMPFAARRRVGVATSTGAMLPDRALGRTEFHAGFLKPLAIRAGVGITIERAGLLNFNLSLVGADDRAPVIGTAACVLEEIAPHLRHAFAFVRKSAVGGGGPDGPVLDRILNVGLIRIGAHGVVQSANPVGLAILAARDGLHHDPAGRINTADPRLAAALDALRSVWRPFPARTRTRRWLVARGADRLPLGATLVEVARGPNEAYFLGPEALLILEDPERGDAPLAELQHHFGLTAAETRVLGLLATGKSVAAVAGALGISVETARTHLKRVLSKTNSQGQSELMRLVSRLTSITSPA